MEKEADQLFNLQQYKEALQLYKKCEQTSIILIRQAEIYDRIGKFKDAIKLYQEAFTQNNSNLRTLIKIGKLNTQIGQYEQAIQIYQQAISIDQKFGLAYGELAYTYYCLENHNLAVENFLKCSELISIVPSFLTQIGDELFSEYKYYTAKLYYSVALKIDPEFIKAYLGVKKYEQSLGVCESLLQRDPNNIEGKLLKIKNLLDMKWIQQAQIQIEQLNALPSTNFNYEQEDQLIYLSAKLLFCQQFYEQCKQYIFEALQRNPFELDLIVLNAQCLMETHCYEEALKELEKVFDVYQNHYEALQLECINNYNLRLIINFIEQRYLKNKIKT